MDTRVFMITGSDDLLISDKIKEIVGSIDNSLEISYLSLADDGIDEILAILNTPTFFGGKCVVIKDAHLIDAKVNEKYYNHLVKYIVNPSEFNILIFIFEKALTTERYSEIKKYATSFEIKDKLDMNSYLERYLKQNNLSIKEDALEYLLKYSEDILQIKQYLDGLICYLGEENEITKEHILELYQPPLENNVYELTNAVIKHNSKSAYKIYQDLLALGMQEHYLLGLLIQKFQESYNISTLVRSGSKQADIAEIYKIKPGRAYYMLQDVKNLPYQVLKKELKALNEIEYRYRSGKMPLDMGLSLYLLSL